MDLIALFAWITTAGIGLYLLSIWLIEYDKDFNAVTETRLPPPLLASHVIMAFGGLLLWSNYVVFDSDRLAWYAVAAMLTAATLGTTMAVRWVSVYRASRAAGTTAKLTLARRNGGVAVLERPVREGPPERNFPLPVVVAHGAFASVTIVLVLLSAFGVFVS